MFPSNSIEARGHNITLVLAGKIRDLASAGVDGVRLVENGSGGLMEQAGIPPSLSLHVGGRISICIILAQPGRRRTKMRQRPW
jgi:hypothetical protein